MPHRERGGRKRIVTITDSGKDGNKMKYHVIAIEREFASGGQQIGSMLGERLGIPCYGREILKMAAKEKGANLEYLEGIEEKATGSVLYSMYVIASMTKMCIRDRYIHMEVHRMELMELLASRRTYRRFEKKEIPQQVLNEILCAARLASSAANRQPLSYVVVRGKKKVERCV